MTDKQTSYYQQSATVLMHMDRFQEAIVKTREVLEIPKSGLSREDRATWYQNYFLDGDLSKEEMNKYFRLRASREFFPPNSEFVSQIIDLLEKFNLDEIWAHELFMHLVTDNDLTPPAGNPRIDVKLKDNRVPEEEWEVTHLSLRIHKDTSIDDIRNVWDRVKKFQKMMPEGQLRKKPWSEENVAQYLKIKELESKGLTHKKIANKLDLQSAQAVSDFKSDIESRFSPD